MKVLFVCKANVGRSQVAQAMFEQLSKHEASSAGADADGVFARDPRPSRQLKDGAARHSIPYMRERGVDIGERVRTQLTPQMAEEADKVIVILPKEDWPDYLVESEKVVMWGFPDPVDMTPEGAWLIFDKVDERVQALVKEIG
jgi:protein-tyrosine-phosphatase